MSGYTKVCVSVHPLMGFPCGSADKQSTCNVGDLGSIPGFGRSPGEGNSYPLQYSSLENAMDCIAHGVAKNWTQLSNFHFSLSSINGHLDCSTFWPLWRVNRNMHMWSRWHFKDDFDDVFLWVLCLDARQTLGTISQGLVSQF